MKAQVLTGSKCEIAATVAGFCGEIHEVIVFVEEPSDSIMASSVDDIFVEMEPFAVKVGGADCSRDSLYGRMENE